MTKVPTISVVIPTYNSARTLAECLASIRAQDYPRDALEIVVADGGSTDSTLEIAREYGVEIVTDNPLRTGEAGKAVGFHASTGEVLALVDSDNVLDGEDWLRRMVEPFADERIAGTEPISYTYRRSDGYITRYSALLGMNDPLCLFLGNYDRHSTLTGRWTNLSVSSVDRGSFIELKLESRNVPTIGANGFMVRRRVLNDVGVGDYLFDTDQVRILIAEGHDTFAKVKIGIIHLFSGSFSTFIRKQRRRVKDYLFYRKEGSRVGQWSSSSRWKLAYFAISTITTLPLIAQAIRGYRKQPDRAWLFHVPACWATLAVYSWEVARSVVSVAPESRASWRG